MGGAAGHMAHPFDCREVRNGKDLINFYVKAVNAIPLYEETDFDTNSHSTSLKLDGVNASFRLQPANNSAGFTFVVDRGSSSPTSLAGQLDRAGITPDNSMARFNPKGNRPDHGMIQVVRHLHQMLNHDLEKLKPYVEALGVFDQMGPDGVFFDVEYFANENEDLGYQRIGNVVPYTQNFIAIHGMKDFFIEEKTSARGKVTSSRKTRGFYWRTNEEINELLIKKDELLAQGQNTSEIDQLIVEKNKELNIRRQEHQEIINDFGKALEEHAKELDLDFNVYTKIGLQFQEGLSRELVLKRIDDELNKELEGFPYKKINEHMSIGPTVINEQTGEVRGRTLKELLLAVEQNPAHVAYYPDQIKKVNKKGEPEPAKGMILASPEWVIKNKKDKNGQQSPFAKKFYEDVFGDGPKAKSTGVGAFNLGADDISGQAINDAVIMWQAVRVIGQILKEAVIADTDLGVPMGQHEGVVIQSNKICDGIAFKFTGDFITGGKVSPFRKDEPQPINETKFKYGKLLESFMPEPIDLAEQEEKQYVILIPGGFKPPTGGHYDLIKQYDKRSNIRKIFVVTGGKERDGITLQQSKDIFAIYGGFSDKVDFITSEDPTPLTTCYELMKNQDFVNQFPNLYFSIGAGDKGSDPRRIKEFTNYFMKNPNLTTAKVDDHPPAKAYVVDGEAASASRLRKAFAEQDWETFKKLLPNEAFYDDVVQVLNSQGAGRVNENFLLAVSQSFLVEGKKQIAAKTEYLIDNEDMPPKQAYAVANSMDKRGKLEEELVTEEKFIDALRPYLKNIFQLEDVAASFAEVGQTVDDADQVIDTLATTISKQLEGIIAQKAAARAEEAEKLASLEEMSSMAAGDVVGGSAPFIGEEEDEQKRSITARV